jgi:hypothetical protein
MTAGARSGEGWRLCAARPGWGLRRCSPTSRELLVAWRHVRPGFTPKTDEDDMIARFREAYGQPPFANYPDRMGR